MARSGGISCGWMVLSFSVGLLVGLTCACAISAGKAGAAASSALPTVPSLPKPRVWANVESGIYHVAGGPFYGKTKTGRWMREEEAVKAGLRKAKRQTDP